MACRGEDGVAERRCRRRGAGLADAARLLRVADLVNVDLRRLADAHRTVVVEVALVDRAARQGDLIVHRRAETEDEAAFDLRDNRVGIDRQAAVDGDGGASQADFASRRNLDLDNAGDVGAESETAR